MLGDNSFMDTTAMYDRIQAAVRARGTTARAVSIEATGKPDAITEIRRGHMPSSTRLRKIADALGVDQDYLLTGEDVPPQLADPRVLFRAPEAPRDVPIYGTALGADIDIDANGHAADIEVTNVVMGEMIGYFPRPRGLIGNDRAYALYIVGSSMEPRFDPGQPVFVDAARPPSIGDDVIVQLVDPDEERVTTSLIKRLVKRTSSYVELRQYNPDITFKIATPRIAFIQRVLTLSDLLGL
jgi:phage repressor protein C with HTH and peptisase S24 domain